MKYKTQIVLAYFASCNLPKPEQEFLFAKSLGRKWRFDFAWPEHKIALEVEGGIFTRGAHGSITGITRDIEKYNAAACLGWRVLRVVPDNLCMLETVYMIREAIKEGACE